MNEFKFSLGQTVKDKITDFTGIILGRTQYLTNCNTYGMINPKLKKDADKMPTWVWIDEPRLKSVNKKVVTLVGGAEEKTGGAMPLDQIAPVH